MSIKFDFRGTVELRCAVRLMAVALSAHGADASVAHVGSEFECAEPGKLYLGVSTGLDAGGAGSVTFIVSGNQGEAEFTFASGTGGKDIASALQEFVEETGVRAFCYPGTPYYVSLHSVGFGDEQFVSVRQIGEAPGIVCDPQAGGCNLSNSDSGVSGILGDATCDGTVGMRDLMTVIEAWDTTCPYYIMSCPADVDHNQHVNVADLLTVIANWGQNGA